MQKNSWVWGVVVFFMHSLAVWATEPPGFPGTGHQWAAARKDAVATTYEKESARSPVWVTAAEGVLSEVFYPTVDFPQNADLQFIIVGPEVGFWEQRKDAHYRVEYSGDGFSIIIHTWDRQKRFSIETKVITDPKRAVVRTESVFKNLPKSSKVYALWKPAMNNDGFATRSWVSKNALMAQAEKVFRGEPVFAALQANPKLDGELSVGYYGVSDPWRQLRDRGKLEKNWTFTQAGSVSAAAELKLDVLSRVELALSFAENPAAAESIGRESLQEGFSSVLKGYEKTWTDYLGSLKGGSKILADESVRRSIQILKTHEDKRNRGAQIAAFSKPGIPYQNYSQENIGGYHLVWPRDLYHSAIGLLSAGDETTPVDTVKYLAKIQKPDGSWWQNFFMDGTPYWKAVQMDQVAFPILLAEQLVKRNLMNVEVPRVQKLQGSTWSAYTMVRKAADFLVKAGSTTEQNRWEEIGGYSPHSMAAQIAGLRAASRLIGDPRYEMAAAQREAEIESRTLVKQGPWGTNYFLRISPTPNPNDQSWIKLANGGSDVRADWVIDGGYLDLVRLNVRSPTDPMIQSTNQVYLSANLDLFINQGPGMIFGRYNGDRYGQGQLGGYWPLLGGEWGEYLLTLGDLQGAENQWLAMKQSANSAHVIPEQLMKNGETGLGVPAPLAWSHAGYIRLRKSIDEGRVFDRPEL